MSLDVYLTKKILQEVNFFEYNITHNLGPMAKEAGLYKHLWRPEELNITKAHQLIEPLKQGLSKLIRDPEKYKLLNPENGWGNYDNLVSFVDQYLKACVQNPDGDVRVSR